MQLDELLPLNNLGLDLYSLSVFCTPIFSHKYHRLLLPIFIILLPAFAELASTTLDRTCGKIVFESKVL